MLDDQQKDDTEAPDDFAPVGKKKGKKNKRQSVSWEEEIIQAVAEEEPKPDETEQATEESDSKTPPLNEDLESGPSQTENELQETPVEVEGKEIFQSSEETHTDQKEKDFDWTDNMVSPQVQSQTEESPFPVRSPISDERDDPDQIHPTTTVDDSQSHEIVIPDTVVEDQLPAAGQQDEGPTELSTPDVQSIKQEAEDIDWTASKSSKKNKKKKKQKSIATMPDESIITEESSPKTPLEQDDNPNTEPEFVQTDQPREIQEEHAVVEDSPLIPDSVSLQVVDNEQPRETQEEPSVVEEVPLVSEPAPPMEAIVEEEFKPSSSSKKKGKKNKKKSDAWSLEELGESIENKNIDQLPAQQSSDSVEEVIAIDSDKTEVPEETPLAPEPAQEEIVEDTTVIPKEIQEEKSLPQEELLESETALIPELPSRKLSKKEKRKMKKGKKIDLEEEEPVADIVEEEQAETVISEKVPETVQEKLDSVPAIDDTPIIDEKPAETELVVDEAFIPIEEQQVADENPAITEPSTTIEEQQVTDMKPAELVLEEVPISTEEQQVADEKPAITEPVLEEPSTTIEEQQVADTEPSEPVLEQAFTTTEEQVADKEVAIAPAREEPVTHKLSKKEKRKNKKRMTENLPAEEPLEIENLSQNSTPMQRFVHAN
uniref:Zonadhesin n=1 Tax=Talaromyces marneffei PM1 TaxID=1077442 RepID=A0A093V4I2_TALMA